MERGVSESKMVTASTKVKADISRARLKSVEIYDDSEVVQFEICR